MRLTEWSRPAAGLATALPPEGLEDERVVVAAEAERVRQRDLLERDPHRPGRALAGVGRRRLVVGVAGRAAADQLTVDGRPALPGVAQRLEHHDPTRFAHHE